ncbi:MAG: FadR/GntR family transcriptional regulator [Negativicutes bacterium]|nr:FadR/GntR family transcriptional regulator [Negativicutes bacterium]
MVVKPIIRRQVSAEIVEQILGNIANGIWSPGTKLPSENELSRLFDTSRVPVREALQKLAAMGVVHTRQGEGTYVLEVTPGMLMNPLLPLLAQSRKNMMEILQYRLIVEAESAALAALNADDVDLARMAEVLAEMDRIRQPVVAFAVADLGFHLEIARATKNSLLFAVSNIIRDILVRYYNKINTIMGIERALKYHPLIFAAIRDRDPVSARRWMQEHIDSTYDDVSQKYIDED